MTTTPSSLILALRRFVQCLALLLAKERVSLQIDVQTMTSRSHRDIAFILLSCEFDSAPSLRTR
jgi:hypothetical protein